MKIFFQGSISALEALSSFPKARAYFDSPPNEERPYTFVPVNYANSHSQPLQADTFAGISLAN